jgi:DNA segregation ATPase FtsK/SpoIIIE-like protein
MPAAQPAPVSIQNLGERIVETFAQYQVPLEIDGLPIVGPTFVRFPLRLGRGVKVKKVESLNRDIKVAIGLEAAPFIHDADGQMVIDVQRPDRQMVLFDEVLDQFPKPNFISGSPRAPIGVNLNGQLDFVDFSDSGSPHLLVAGTTSSGKSAWLISAIAGLNLLNSPNTLRYVLIDPKRNAFTWMKNSEYLLKPVVFPDETDVVEVFESLVAEMDRRYSLFDGDSDLQSYMARTGKTLPRLICICDEFYDLLASGTSTRQEIERLIARLGSKSRAAGIHLVLATQQPSRRVISGILDANIPARVGLKTSKDTESRMLLGVSGAENLLGHGDLLFKAVGEPRRYQGIYLPENERAKYARPRAVDKANW